MEINPKEKVTYQAFNPVEKSKICYLQLSPDH